MFAKIVGPLSCAAVLAGCNVLGPQPTTLQQAMMPQLAYIGSDDQVYVAAPDGSGSVQLTSSVVGLADSQGWTYRWPTYSPNARRLAFAGYRTRAGQLVSAAVLVADITPANALALLESSDLAPIYLYWSPDNRHVSALLQRQSALELHLLDAAAQDADRVLAIGQPLYWSWAPDGASLAVHIGGDATAGNEAWVGVLHLEAGNVREERFSDAPGGFRAPAWAPGGEKLAYLGLGGGQSILTIRDAAGRVSRLATSPTDVAVSWAPNGDWLAFASLSNAGSLYQGVEVVRPDGSERHRLADDLLAGFYWAPDGKRLALLGVDMQARELVWSAIQVDGKARRTLGSFVPSNDFAFQLPFFDQYAQSTSVWSPDGKKLVYGSQGGSTRQDGSATGERLMVLDVEGQSPPRAVAQGSIAVWSPAVTR